MTGSDIAWWLQGIFDDLLDLGSANVPLLVFKLFVLFVVSFFGWQLGRVVLRAVWSVTGPLLLLLWRIVTAPVRLPWRGVRRLYGGIRNRRFEQLRQRETLAAAERQRDREREQARKDARRSRRPKGSSTSIEAIRGPAPRSPALRDEGGAVS